MDEEHESEVTVELRDALAKLEELEERVRTLQEEMQERTVALDQERAARRRLEVAAAKGLPTEFAPRLKGATEQEWAADADELLRLFPLTSDRRRNAPGVPPAGKTGGVQSLDLDRLSPGQIRAKWSELFRR